MPLMPGMCRSEMTASNRSPCKVAKASLPLLAVPHWKAGGPKMRERSLQAADSSSTARTRAAGRCPDGIPARLRSPSTGETWSFLATTKAHPPLLQHPGPRLLYELASILAERRTLRARMNNFCFAYVFSAGAPEIDIHNGISRELRGTTTQEPAQTHVLGHCHFFELLPMNLRTLEPH